MLIRTTFLDRLMAQIAAERSLIRRRNPIGPGRRTADTLAREAFKSLTYREVPFCGGARERARRAGRRAIW